MTALARTLLAAIAALFAVTARANGEAVRETGAIYGTFGDLAPIDRSDIALLAEDLTIMLGAQSGPAWSLTTEGWSARAEYRLFNPGPSRAVRFKLPLAWPKLVVGSPFGSDDADDMSPDAILGASAIKFTMRGKTVPCEELSWNATFTPYVAAAGFVDAYEGQCVASLSIPSGESTLILEYPANFTRGWQGSMRLRYALWPAGHWRGPVRDLSVTVELGEKAPLARIVSPPGAVVRDGTIKWKLPNVDVNRAGAIVIDLPPSETKKWRGNGWVPVEWSGAGWVRVDAPVEVSASSTLPPQGRARYAASLVLDGDRGTAWCEGADDDGAGQSLSFSFRLPPDLSGGACAVRDVTLVRGHSRTATTWSENGRVTAARIESCSRPEDGFDVNVAPRRWSDDPNIWPNVAKDVFDTAMQEINFPAGILESEHDCVRFVIRGVAAGTKYHDTCISELVPRVYCRTVVADAR